jgi:aspartate/methionine/tyrosine aminotransferase
MARGHDSYLTSRLRGFGSTIFAEMTALANEKGAINLGQGFPDYDGPPAVRRPSSRDRRTPESFPRSEIRPRR